MDPRPIKALSFTSNRPSHTIEILNGPTSWCTAVLQSARLYKLNRVRAASIKSKRPFSSVKNRFQLKREVGKKTETFFSFRTKTPKTLAFAKSISRSQISDLQLSSSRSCNGNGVLDALCDSDFSVSLQLELQEPSPDPYPSRERGGRELAGGFY